MNPSACPAHSDTYYKSLLDCLFDAVYTVDDQGLINYWNAAAQRLTGFSAPEVLGQHYQRAAFMQARSDHEPAEPPPSDPIDPPHGGVDIVLTTGTPGTWKGFVRRKNGQRIPVESHISPLPGATGATAGAVAVFRDVSASAALEQAHRDLLEIARRDQLTGMYNRAAIAELLKAEIARSKRYQQPLSVVMIDIDHFKKINDQYGHDAGDKVLAHIGALLVNNIRLPDAAGRWGGEEFLVIAPGSDTDAAAGLAQRIRLAIKAISIAEVPAAITASFGVARFTDDQNPDQLLARADQALYRAKQTGRDRVVTAGDATGS